MTALVLALMTQYLVATKAGLINHVQGGANVKPLQIVAQGAPIQTTTGFVEILLTPGSFLRIGPNSEVVLEGIELTNVAARISAGEAVLEVLEVNKQFPVKIMTGTLSVQVSEPGIYRFKDGLATVVEGKLSTLGTKIPYGKGWQVSYTVNYRATKVPGTDLTSLDYYSMNRSGAVSTTNSSIRPVDRMSVVDRQNSYWLITQGLPWFTYMSTRNVRSPYGYNFFSWTWGGYAMPNGGRNNNNTDVTNAASNSSGNNNTNNNNSGSSNSGFTESSPRTFGTPSGERATPAEYQGSKNTAVPTSAPPPPPQR